MNGLVLGSALLGALATAGAMRPPPALRRPVGTATARLSTGGRSDALDPIGQRAVAEARTGPRLSRRIAAGLLAGGAVGLLIEGVFGALAGFLVLAVVPVVLGHLEPAAQRRERLALVRAAPIVADLLGAALSAGVPLEHATPAVGRALGGPVEDRLLEAHRRIALGESATAAYATLVATPGLGAIARCVVRSTRTGAPVAHLLGRVAVDLRAEAAAAAMEQVRATAVRAVLPLGLCLLPGFVLLGIVPIVGGLLPKL